MKALVLTSQNKEDFKVAIKQDRPTLMLYYASWCGHCQSLHPTWEALKKKLELQNGILVGEVEYSNMQALPAGLQNIRGFPTIQVLEKGKVKSEYQGDRRLDALLDFAMSHVRAPKPAAKAKAVAAKPKTAAAKPKPAAKKKATAKQATA